MEILLPILVTVGIVIMVLGTQMGSALDPVQARLQQIAVRPRSLEELELQRPLSDRTLKPIIRGLAGLMSRFYPANTANALDLLTISVEAGLGFDAALVKVTEKLKGALSDEFKRAASEQRVGKSRQEALRGITQRVEQKELGAFISAIIQADQLGVSMSKVLRIQSEQMRGERRQRAEEKAAKAPILIMLPTIGCIFPSLFIVILAPAALSAMSSCGSF